MQLNGFAEVSPILGSGVYALVKRGTVIYIGQSKSLYQRIYAHKHNARQAAKGKAIPAWLPAKGFIFDQVFVHPCHVDDLDRVEREMINLYKPKYNESLKVGGNVVKAEVALNIGGAVITMNQRSEGIRRL